MRDWSGEGNECDLSGEWVGKSWVWGEVKWRTLALVPRTMALPWMLQKGIIREVSNGCAWFVDCQKVKRIGVSRG